MDTSGFELGTGEGRDQHLRQHAKDRVTAGNSIKVKAALPGGKPGRD